MILQTGKNNQIQARHHFSSLGLKSDPFGVTPDPDYYYPLDAHQSCLAMLEIGIRQKRGLHIIVGEIGAGKTTLSRCLLRNLQNDPEHIIKMILNPVFNDDKEFYSELASIFDLSVNYPPAQVAKELKIYLLNKFSKEEKTVTLLVDEAQKLSLQSLEALRILLNFETNNTKLIQIVLFGQVELKNTLFEMKNFIERANYKYQIPPITLQEMIKLLNFRLQKSSTIFNNKIFSKKALKLIYEYSGGIPRKVCLIAHRTLEILIIKNRKKADEKVIKEIINQENFFNE